MKTNQTTPNLNPAFDLDIWIGFYCHGLKERKPYLNKTKPAQSSVRVAKWLLLLGP